MNSLNHCNHARKFIPMPQGMKIQDAKSSSGERMGVTRENAGMAADESQKQK